MSKGGAAMSDAQNRNVNPEDKRQYLGFIQDIISRMAGNSSSLKEWFAPILTLVFAIAALKQEIRIYVFLAGLLVAVAFALWMRSTSGLNARIAGFTPKLLPAIRDCTISIRNRSMKASAAISSHCFHGRCSDITEL